MGVRSTALLCVLLAQTGCAWGAVRSEAARLPPTYAPAVTPLAEPQPMPPHPVIEAYIRSLESILSEQEKLALRGIDLDGTNVGDTQRLRYLAADRAVRVFLPAALDASRNPVLRDYARRIRELPPLLNPDTDAVAHDLVTAALRARGRLERGETLDEPSADEQALTARADTLQVVSVDPAVEVSPDASELVQGSAVSVLRVEDDGAKEEYAEALAIYAETYGSVFGVSKLHADAAAAAAADAADAAVLLTEAIARGADRDELVQEGLMLVQRMAEAARRREHIPIPKHKQPPVQE